MFERALACFQASRVIVTGNHFVAGFQTGRVQRVNRCQMQIKSQMDTSIS